MPIDTVKALVAGKQALAVAIKQKNKRDEGWSYKYIGKVYGARQEINTEIVYLKKCLDLYLVHADKAAIATTYNGLGLKYYNTAQYMEAIPSFIKAAEIYLEVNDSIGAAQAYNNSGIMADVGGKPVRALELYFKSLAIYEKASDKLLQTGTLQNIGIVYTNQKNYDDALYYYKRAQRFGEELDDDYSLAKVYSNIGIIYDKKEIYDTARTYFESAKKLAIKLNDNVHLATTLTNLGANAELRGSNFEAMEYYTESVKIKKKIGNDARTAIAILGLANVYIQLDNNEKAYNLGMEAYDYAENAGYFEYIKGALSVISTTAYHSKRYKEAYDALRHYVYMNDSVINSENNQIMQELTVKYDTDKKKQEIALLTKNQEVKDLQLSRNKIMMYAGAGGISLLLVLCVVAYRSYINKKKDNKNLSEKNVKIEEQRSKIEHQRDVLTVQKKEMTDSINYAKRLQDAILPSEKEIQTYLPQSFVLFKPRDIVSGDFYWFTHQNNKSFIAAVDCTGHGVPGAFVSMVGHNLLNQIVIEDKVCSASEILTKLNQGVKNTFIKEQSNVQTNDGMDLALCVIDHQNKRLDFAGAKNPLLIARDHTLTQIKGDKNAIGGITLTEHIFESTQIELDGNETFYIYSDGYQDQFGGPKGKKFMVKNFKNCLLKIHKNEFKSQEEELLCGFYEWKNTQEQVDDVLVVGFKV